MNTISYDFDARECESIRQEQELEARAAWKKALCSVIGYSLLPAIKFVCWLDERNYLKKVKTNGKA